MKAAVSQAELRRLELLAVRAARGREALDAIVTDAAAILGLDKDEAKWGSPTMSALHAMVWEGAKPGTVLSELGLGIAE